MVQHISSGSDFEKDFGYSRAVVDGDMIYVSGTTGYDYKNMVLPNNIAEQTKNIFATIEKTLREANSSLEDIVRVRYYLKDKNELEQIRPIIAEKFANIRPAATLIIADLIREEIKIEIEVTARIGAGKHKNGKENE